MELTNSTSNQDQLICFDCKSTEIETFCETCSCYYCNKCDLENHPNQRIKNKHFRLQLSQKHKNISTIENLENLKQKCSAHLRKFEYWCKKENKFMCELCLYEQCSENEKEVITLKEACETVFKDDIKKISLINFQKKEKEIQSILNSYQEDFEKNNKVFSQQKQDIESTILKEINQICEKNINSMFGKQLNNIEELNKHIEQLRKEKTELAKIQLSLDKKNKTSIQQNQNDSIFSEDQLDLYKLYIKILELKNPKFDDIKLSSYSIFNKKFDIEPTIELLKSYRIPKINSIEEFNKDNGDNDEEILIKMEFRKKKIKYKERQCIKILINTKNNINLLKEQKKMMHKTEKKSDLSQTKNENRQPRNQRWRGYRGRFRGRGGYGRRGRFRGRGGYGRRGRFRGRGGYGQRGRFRGMIEVERYPRKIIEIKKDPETLISPHLILMDPSQKIHFFTEFYEKKKDKNNEQNENQSKEWRLYLTPTQYGFYQIVCFHFNGITYKGRRNWSFRVLAKK
ncbi:e3 ubiquitin-protein ligase trim [Anaeramoeba flamelloides]|uniref:E3 ubiquitin-protein ligase trim n=1 Tax=Anaeramoeba flamelloides TaxID=1746091 RepID=A0AAV7ZUC5_9EUKA|nr:e3 ubiquitin-protein ligase trim [Anaeramoeba flamelloides]